MYAHVRMVCQARGYAMNDEPDDDDIHFLTRDEVVTLQRESIRRYSPSESLNIINPSALESAVSQPQVSWGGQYLYESLADMAAAYLVGLVQNHAFENGNKRVGFAAASIFLRMNGFQLTLTEDEAIDLTLNVATGEMDREAVAEIIQKSLKEM